jgi:ribosome-associated protein
MHDNPSDDDFVISKSQKKREMLALQDLGKELTKHAPARLKKIPMSDALREALNEMHRITANGARARQLQYIGKLMRTEETGPIRAGLEALAALAGRAGLAVGRELPAPGAAVLADPDDAARTASRRRDHAD